MPFLFRSKLLRWCQVLALGFFLPALGAPEFSLPVERIPFQTYGVAQGLGNLSVWCLEQDSDGFLWVGTEDGLFRYEGNRFQAFRQESGLETTWVRTLRAGKNGRMWIGTTHGLALREQGRIRRFTESDGMPQADVFALVLDAGGRLWVGTDRGLFRERTGSGFEAVPGWQARAPARCLWMAGKGMFITSESRLLHFDQQGGRAPEEVPGPWKERLDAVLEDGLGRMWVRSRGRLWVRKGPAGAFEDLTSRIGPAAYDGSLKLTARGTLLIPTVEGLMRVTGQGWELIGAAQGLPTPYVNRALEDQEGCLWVGGLGLHRALSHEAWGQYTSENGIAGGVIWAIARSNEGRIWAGSTNGVCEARDGKWTVVPGTHDQAVLAFAMASDGALWMGGAPARLRRWVPGTNQWTELARPDSTITSMAFDPEGVLWVATRRQGLFRVSRQGASYASEPFALPGAVPEEHVQRVTQGREGRLWLTSTDGLLVLEHGTWRRLGLEQGLKSLHTLAAQERSNGELWVSYQDVQGLSRFRRQEGRLALVEHLDGNRGFSARKAYFMREDALERLWVGTSQGVVLYAGGRFNYFGTMDGLPGDDCNGSAFMAEPGGNVWVGTLGGLGRFHQDRFEGSPKPPVSFVLSAEYGGASLVPPFPEGLRIRRRDATVEFRFAGLTYLNEHRVIHQVRLVGLEDTWRTTDIRQARYTSLGPGTYRFEVRAGFGDGTWGPVAKCSFRVLPAWWQSWWFRTLAVLFLGGIAAAIMRLRMKALEHRNFELATLVETRTHALAEANEVLKQLTVTDPLTGLKNRRFLDLTIQDDLAKIHRDYQSLARGQGERILSNVDMLFLMVDLDHFKQVNDTYGHAAGDLMLQQVRDRLLEATRTSDTVVRWGGEEFLVVARHTDRTLGNTLAQRILDLMRSRPFDLGNGVKLHKTCSLGYCPYPMIPDCPDALAWQRVVELADRCLYAAKLSGRDGWVGFNGLTATLDSVNAFLESPEGPAGDGKVDLLTSFQDVAGLRWR